MDFVKENLMASLGKELTIVQFFSEGNAVDYKIDACGSSETSRETCYLKLNNKALAISPRPGLNLALIRNNTIVEQRNFTLSNDLESFKTYLNSLTSGILVMYTSGTFRPNANAESFFNSIGSSSFPREYLTSNYHASYVAVYSPFSKKISIENTYCDDGSERGNAKIETVYDVEADIGKLGSPMRVYETFNKLSGAQHELAKLPETLPVNIADYNIKPGENLLVSFDGSTSGLANNITGLVSIRFFNNSSLVKVEDIKFTGPESRTILVPSCNKFTIFVGKSANNPSGSVTLNSLVVTHASTDNLSNKSASFGVNGIKNSGISDVSGREILTLVNPKTNKNKININKIIEQQ